MSVFRLYKELWDNQPNELNDSPACQCSLKARQIGTRHGIYEGEKEIPEVNPFPLHKFHGEFQFVWLLMNIGRQAHHLIH